MRCRDCPYGEEDFKKRMYWYEKTVSEMGIPNDIYHYLKPEDVPDKFEQFLWCDKVGGKVFWAYRCSDAYSEPLVQTRNIAQKKKRRNKRERDLKHKRHLKTLYENNHYYPAPVIYTDGIYVKGKGWVDNPKPYYKRRYHDNHKCGRYKYYKKYSNRCVRRYKGEIHIKGNQYRKIFDYWWTVD